MDNNDLSQQFESIEQLLTESPEKALDMAEYIFSDHPESEPVKVLYARCLRMCNKLDSAQRLLENLIVDCPANIPAYMELSVVLNNKELYHGAIDILTRVTKIAPEYHIVWELLSKHLLQIDDYEGAKQALAQHDTIKEFNEQLNKAQEYFDSSQFNDSEKMCRHLLSLIPTEIRTLRLMAKISIHFKHFEIAVSILEYCLLQKPDDINIGIDYADSLLRVKQEAKALTECERLEKLSPDNIKLAVIKAEALVKCARYQEALESYHKLISVHSRKDLCLLRYGSVLLILGRSEEAIASYKEALALSPDLGEAYWNLANMKTFEFSSEDINLMKEQLNNPSISNESAIYINFSLGKALEDKQQYEESFTYYKQANDAQLKSIPEVTIDNFKTPKSFFTKKYFSQIKDQGHDSDAPIFIVGLRRSGSTLLEQILSSHSEVDGMSELSELAVIAAELTVVDNQGRHHYSESLAKLSSEQIKALGQKYLDKVAPLRKEGKYFIDKLPSNYKLLGLVKAILPNAKIIDIRRNPMACGWSLYKHFFAEGSNYSYDLSAIGQHYNNYVSLMSHWNSIFAEQMYSVNYEELIDNLEDTAKSILDYCGLDFEEACLEFYKNERPVSTISSEQVRQPIYKAALTQWKNYEDFLIPLDKSLNNY